jgi:hypothetical protein
LRIQNTQQIKEHSMLYYAQGSAILTEDELFEPSNLTKISNFDSDLSAGRSPDEIIFSTGKLAENNVIRNVIQTDNTGDMGTPSSFQPIGLGLPLTVMIREVYTGNHPNFYGLGLEKPLLVTSAIKSITTSEAKPPALNFLKDAVKQHERLNRPSASKQGTPFVFYSPALIEKSLTLDLSLVFDDFDQQIFNLIGDAFQSAAGIPIFLSNSVYLIAAGATAKIAGNIFEALFDNKPVFSASEALDIYWPGASPVPPGFRLITDGNVDSIDKDFRKNYRVNERGQVVDTAEGLYDGDIPYIVISLDGSLQEGLLDFTPTAASAAILSKFLGMKDGQQQLSSSLMDALKLYNDFKFRQEVDKIDALPEGAEKKNLKDKRDALSKNILTDLLKKSEAITSA